MLWAMHGLAAKFDCLSYRRFPILNASTAVVAMLLAKPASSQATAPQLTAITLTSPSTLMAGSSLTYSFAVEPGTYPIKAVYIEISGTLENITNHTGIVIQIQLTGNLQSDTASINVPAYWLNGTYAVGQIAINDGEAITQYNSDGTVAYQANEAGSQSNPMSAALNFALVGGSALDNSPTISSITLISNQVSLGGLPVFNVEATPGTTGTIPFIEITAYPQGSTQQYDFDITPNAPGSDVWSANQSYTALPAGAYTINYINVYDGFADVNYQASGPPVPDGATVVVGPWNIDFASLNFTVYNGSVPVSPAPLTIQQQPSSASATTGREVLLGALVTGTNLTYQWNFNGVPILGANALGFELLSAQPSDSGSYTLTITDANGATLTTQGAVVAVAPATGGPTVSNQPTGATISIGSSVVFNAGAAEADTTYQWYLNGIPFTDREGSSVSGMLSTRAASGSTSTTLFISNATTADAGAYSCLITNSVGSALTKSAVLNISSTANPGRLIDLSCRAPVGTGAGTLIAGFATGGSGTTGNETLLIRASGPALAQFSLTDLLPDPVLGLFDSQQRQIASNSGWAGGSTIASAASEVGAFEWTSTSSHDSALLQTLSPGTYTAEVSGASGDTGLGLVEVYDDTPTVSYTSTSSRLVNISARIDSGTGANILIAGFVIGGNTSKTLLIRGSGPALAQFGLSGLLPDPKLQVFDGSQQLIASNTSWGGNAQIASVAASVGAFTWGNSATPDSALLLTLPPGAYTAQVSGSSGDTGVTLVEVYDVP
jgi:hypothetical protein